MKAQTQADIANILFKVTIIVFLMLMTYNVYKLNAQKYTYDIVFAEDINVIDTLNQYGDIGCIVDSARRATSGDNIYDSKVGYEFVFRCSK